MLIFDNIHIFSFLRSGIKKDYDIEKTIIGEGKFATVRCAVHRHDGQKVAVKTIFKDRIKKNKVFIFKKCTPVVDALNHPYQEETLANEIVIMKMVHHKNCIQFYESR